MLTEECRIQTGLDENAIRSAHPLEQVLDEVSSVLYYKSIILLKYLKLKHEWLKGN